jgi:non-ribosomal peptide synthetase component F
MVLHAATGVVLHGLSDQDDLIIGSPVANRRWAETEALIGFFVNTLAIRVRMAGDPTFRELLARSRESAIRAYGHQELPFDLVVQAVRPKRHPNRNPLFQCNLRVQTATPAPPVMKGIRCRHLSVGFDSSRFDVALGFADEPGDLNAYLEYNAALFDHATALAWIDGIVEVFERISSDPDARLSHASEPLHRTRS